MNISTRNSAQDLLNSTNILQLLAEFGEVHVVGSYAFDLMTEPDIDIVVVTPTPKESSEKALAHISQLHLFQKLEYGDFQKFPRENRPPFYIFNMRTPHVGDMWEIETWFMPDATEKIAFAEKMKSISQAQRDEIMRLKQKRRTDGVDKHTLSSFDIYKQVLGF